MKKSLRLVALLALFALVVAACGGGADDTTTTAAGGETTTTAAETTTTAAETTTTTGETTPPTEFVHVPVKVGTLLPQTGPLSVIFDAMNEAVQLAISEVEAAGGTIELVEADDGTDPNVASTAVDGLLNADVDAIIGAAASSVSLAVIDKITSSQVVQCSPSNTGAVFTTYEDDGFYFRTAPSDVLQGPALADVIAEDGHTDVAIIYLNDEYGVGLADVVADGVENSGGNVVARVPFDPAATSFDTEVGQAAAVNPEAVVVISFAQGVGITQAMIEAGLGPDQVGIYVTDGYKDSVVATEVDPDNPAVLEGIRGTAPSAAPENGEPTFPTRFAEFAPDAPTIFSAQSYDCLMIIALAAQVAGEGGDIVSEMNGVTSGGTKCVSYEECVALIAAGEDIDFDGASGPLEFTDAGEPGVGTYDVYTYDAEGNPVTDKQVVAGQ